MSALPLAECWDDQYRQHADASFSIFPDPAFAVFPLVRSCINSVIDEASLNKPRTNPQMTGYHYFVTDHDGP
jgi:hypothetical protein